MYLFRKFISTKKPSLRFSSTSKRFVGISSLTYNRIPPPWTLRSSPKGGGGRERTACPHKKKKGCYNRSTKIDLLQNWHQFLSQISSGYLLSWICSSRNSSLFLKELTFKCAVISLFKFFLGRALRSGFPATSSQILGYDSLLQYYLR